MRVFAKVVESASFTGAAARLGISASMVSQHVKELEERLGARLLNRTTRKVSLTDTGRAYYERCTRLLADLEETEQAVSDMHAAPRGELRVNAAPTFGIVQLAPAIADFTTRFPAISVELILSERIADLIDEGFDVAVWVGELPDSSLVARQLAPCRMVVCGAPSYFEKHGTPRTPELDQRVPVAPVARQTRRLDREHGTDATLADRREQPLKARTADARTRAAKIVIDSRHIRPAESASPFGEPILTPPALMIVDKLVDGGLADVDEGAARQMIRRDLHRWSPPQR